MGLFDKLKSKNSKSDKAKLSREDILNNNEGIPFTIEIADDKADLTLSYVYDRVKCKIIGDVSGLKEGAILYAREGGILANVLKEEVAKIENKKISQMVNDLRKGKGKLASMRVKFVSIENDSLYCNIGFWTSSDDEDDDEEDDDDEKYINRVM